MKNKILALMATATLFTLNPVFAMDSSELEDKSSIRLTQLKELYTEYNAISSQLIQRGQDSFPGKEELEKKISYTLPHKMYLLERAYRKEQGKSLELEAGSGETFAYISKVFNKKIGRGET